MKKTICRLFGGVPIEEHRQAVEALEAQRDIVVDHIDVMERFRRKHELALAKICEQETPNSNATVRRMVRIARDGLNGDVL